MTDLRQALEEPPNSTTDFVESEKPCEWVGLTDNEILDTKFAKRFIDDVYAIVGQRDLLAFARELEEKWKAHNELHKR